MVTLYSMQHSGNSYKIRLLLQLIGCKFSMVDMDKWAGDMRDPRFMKISPAGKAPIVILEDGTVLRESNAILYYFAKETPYWPTDRLDQARVLQWMFFEQYDHEPNIAVRMSLLTTKSEDQDKLQATLAGGYRALDIMEKHLAENTYFGAEHISIADICLYAYTHKCYAGGFSLDNYPNIPLWLSCIKSLPNYVSYSWQAENTRPFKEIADSL